MKRQFVRLGCGIDISSKKLDVCFGGQLTDGTFKVLASKASFKNTSGDIKKFVLWINRQLNKHQPDSRLPFQIVMETTGSYHENLLSALYAAGLPVCLERAARVKKFLHSIGQYSKNDQLDARGICRLASERNVRLWKPFSPQTMELRGVLRQRHSLVKSRTRFKNQLHAANAGHYANRSVKKAIKQLIKQLDKQIKALEKEAVKLYQKDNKLQKYVSPIVGSFRGVGLLTLLTIFAETNGFAQIKSRRGLSRYAGLNVIENQSGFISRPTKISKKGNSRIRAILYMCALSIISSKDGPIYKKYLRIVERNPKAKKVAVIAVMREVLEMIYTLFKSGKPYDPNHVWSKSQPKANRQSTENESAPELRSEAHGIAA